MASSLATCCRERRGCGWPPGSSRSCRCSSWSAASPTWRAGRRWSAAAAATSSTCRAGCRGCCGRCSSSRPSGWYFRRCSATSGCRRSRPGRSAGSWASRCGSSATTWWSWPWHRLWCGCTGAGGSGFPPRWPRRPGRPHRDGPVPAQHGRAARRPVEHEPADHLHRGAGHLAARPGDARARAGVGLARPTPPLDRRHRRRIDGDDRVPVAPHRNGYGPRARPGRTWPTAHPRRRPVVGHPSHLARPARRRPHPDGPVPVRFEHPRRRRAPAAERPAGEAPPVPSGGERAAAGAAGARAPGVGESPLGRLAVILGLGFATLGLLGFVVTGFAPLLGSSELLPFLHVDPLGNLLHLLVGMQLASASGSGATARPGPWVLTAAGSAVLLALPCADPLTLTLHATVAVLALAIAATRRGPQRRRDAVQLAEAPEQLMR